MLKLSTSKQLLFFLGGLMIISTVFSCTDASSEVDTNQDLLFNDTSSTTGELIIEVIDESDDEIDLAMVSIYVSYEDLLNEIDLLTLETSNNGRVNFGSVNFGNYYIKAIKTVSSTEYITIDIVQVRSNKTVIKNVLINMSNI